jgi:hypothetical protein
MESIKNEPTLEECAKAEAELCYIQTMNCEACGDKKEKQECEPY